MWKCQLNDAIVLLPGDRTTQVALSAESSRHQEANRRTNRARVLGTNSRGSQDLHLCCIVFLTVLQARVCACSLLTRARSLLTRSLVRYWHAPHACVCTCMCVNVFKTMAITTRSSSNEYAMMMLWKITIVRCTSGGNSGTQRNTTQWQNVTTRPPPPPRMVYTSPHRLHSASSSVNVANFYRKIYRFKKCMATA